MLATTLHLCLRAGLPLILWLSALPGAEAQRRLNFSLSPERTTLQLGEARQFRPTLNRRNVDGVTWSLKGDGPTGTITSEGYYRAPTECVTPATITLVAEIAHPEEDGETLTASATITLSAVSIEVNPSRTSLNVGEGRSFNTRVRNAPDERVRWSIDGGSGNGLITEGGHYTAPARFLTPGAVTIRATSVADPSKSATATITIEEVRVQIENNNVELELGENVRLEARVRGAVNDAVEWRLVGEAKGELTAGGLYTTPTRGITPAVVIAEARSVADPTKSAQARIEIKEVELKTADPPAARRRSFLPNLRYRVLSVIKLTIPLDPIDNLIRGPVFRGRSGKLYIPVGGATLFHAEVKNARNDNVIWSVEGGDERGTINQEGIYFAPDAIHTPNVIQIRATAAADPSKFELLTLHIPPVLVEGPRDPVTVPMGTAKQLSVDVENSENQEVIWRVQGGAEFGSIDEDGLYIPPDSIITPATVAVRATSAADPTKHTTIQIRIPAVSISITTRSPTVRPGQNVRLSARVRGSDNEAVEWSVLPEIGTIGPDGVYQAPANPMAERVQVVATSAADPTKTATVTVRIRQ